LAGDRGFDFIVTGEVIGQRPKSQRKDTMPIISQESGADDRLLRPLCAQNLPATLPEREGWVKRDELHDFSGRTRKPQMALAEKFGLEEFAQPAGGCCFLTDKSYSNKLADLWTARNERRYELDDIMLLKVGRHIRPQPHFKLIISREEGENRFLEGYRYQFTSITTVSCPGPLALVDGQFESDAEMELAAAIVARYSKGRVDEAVTLDVRSPDGVARQVTVVPAQPEAVLPSWNVG
jgi:tRNA U34 2-thiouridine synthase MnmA/TrmU